MEATRHIGSSLKTLRDHIGHEAGYNIRSRKIARSENDFTMGLEVKVVDRAEGAVGVRIYTFIYGDKFVNDISADYSELPPYPMVFAEPYELARIWCDENERAAVLQRWKLPLELKDELDAQVLAEALIDTYDNYSKPTFNLLQTDLIAFLRAGFLEGGAQARGDAYIEILSGNPHKWHWSKSNSDNLLALGLNPDDYYYGWRKSGLKSWPNRP